MTMGGESCDYHVRYNAKDVIQYALSVGVGSNVLAYDQDIPYVFEDHVNFSVLPTFAFVLIFWAKRNGDDVGNTSTIPQFPPPIMKYMGVIPKESLKTNMDVHKYPLIHTSQSIVWEKNLPTPTRKQSYVNVMIRGKFVSVDPKLVGTFVKTEYTIYEKVNDTTSNGAARIGRVQFTTLILGIPSKMIQPYKNSNNNSESLVNTCFTNCNPIRSFAQYTSKKRLLLFEEDYYIAPNTALLYRLASGDSNPMHVDPKAIPDMGRNGQDVIANAKLPFIHGLCTLGIVARMILQHVQTSYADDSTKVLVQFLDCRFKMPVYINDTIIIRAWEVSSNTCFEKKISILCIEFNVTQKSSDLILVDSGKMYVSLNHSKKTSPKLRSFL
jgi:acyl dehydratase